MAVTIALAGDTMLGRGVADALTRRGTRPLFTPAVHRAVSDADLFPLDLECCVSDRGTRIDRPGRTFFFRASPRAADILAGLGVDAVSLAYNHALDHGPAALLDARAHLAGAGIATVETGADLAQARAPLVLEAGGLRVGLVGATDHPAECAAGEAAPGAAYAAPWREGVPAWLTDTVRRPARQTDLVVVSMYWGPDMTACPVSHVRDAASALTDAGADLVVGYSAHVFHGFTRRVLYDLCDFIDDYAVHPALRNDLSLLWLVTLDASGPTCTEAVPIALDHCRTSLADRAEYDWVADRLARACAEPGTRVTDEHGRLSVDWRRTGRVRGRPGRSAPTRGRPDPARKAARASGREGRPMRQAGKGVDMPGIPEPRSRTPPGLLEPIEPDFPAQWSRHRWARHPRRGAAHGGGVPPAHGPASATVPLRPRPLRATAAGRRGGRGRSR
ncbi:CapA family protein [Streptomyces canus]|uniref:CapA family protein n=1 Tax=Streptomyces canus TaxID=58343 RepID=UPI002258188D|nr:CapA family protein [Streptomyces canus]MCX4853882.1 CapA family protein [Streptomyces canus]WSW40653.1 CapA family protein [Streptomyces canus]